MTAYQCYQCREIFLAPYGNSIKGTDLFLCRFCASPVACGCLEELQKPQYQGLQDLQILKRGMIVRNKANKSTTYVVTANYGERVTAAAVADITNPSEWEIFIGDQS